MYVLHTFDNATITDENGRFVEMPILPDWYDVLSQSPDTKHLAVVLARAAGFVQEMVKTIRGLGGVACKGRPLDLYVVIPQVTKSNSFPSRLIVFGGLRCRLRGKLCRLARRDRRLAGTAAAGASAGGQGEQCATDRIRARASLFSFMVVSSLNQSMRTHTAPYPFPLAK